MTGFVEEVNSARDALREMVPASPLQRAPGLSLRYGADIWLKREGLRLCR
jgi:threonine dehydratase